jgi:Phospholipase_D-nuclease N-terminal
VVTASECPDRLAEERQPVVAKAPPDVGDDGRRRGVEPLDVVDEEQEWTVLGENAQRREERDAEWAGVRKRRALLEQERDTKRTRLRHGERIEHVVDDRLEEVAQPRERELRLPDPWTSGERREAANSRRFERERAERRLPDSRLAFDDDDGREQVRVEGRTEGRELVLAPDKRVPTGGHRLGWCNARVGGSRGARSTIGQDLVRVTETTTGASSTTRPRARPGVHRVRAARMVWRILIVAAVGLFLVLWVRAVLDLLRRPDLSGVAKAAWAIGMLVLPFIGLLVYTMLRPADSQIAQRRRA